MNPRPNIPMQNPHRRPLWSVTLLALLLLLAASPGTAAVRASLDRDTVYSDDIFILTIESDGQSSGQQPDLSPLEKDFEVLGTRTSTQVRIFNGRRSDKIQWHVQLQPRREGQLRIPPINVNGQRTNAITLTVNEAPQQPALEIGRHVFIESETGTGDQPVYVQQQIPYTVRLYYDDRLQEGEISAPEVENAVVERLGEDKRYTTVRNGHRYRVIERNYVISAEKSGGLSIPPARFQGRIAVQQQHNRRPRSPLDEFFTDSPFANDPFFRNRLLSDPFANSGQPVNIRSRAIDMVIKPRPATASHPWLPAEAIELGDSWTENPPQFVVGEPVTRTITIQVMGLSASQIPELNIAEPANTRLYPEPPTQENRTDGKTIYGLRTRTLTYIPNAQGVLDIPPVTLRWWDTRQDKPADTTLPAWQFTVQPGAAADAMNDVQETRPQAEDTMQNNLRWLIAGGGLFLALVLLLAILIRRAKRRQRIHVPATGKTRLPAIEQHHPANRKSALRELQKACAANDRHTAAQALLKLGHSYWPDDPPHSLSALAARIETGQTPLRELDRSLYAAETADWNGSMLWDAFKHGLQEKKAAGQHRDDGLKPLYPGSF